MWSCLKDSKCWGTGSAEAETAVKILREKIPALGNTSSQRTPESSFSINISFSVFETVDRKDFD